MECGYAVLTVEAIARRAGVARQTIYRWWDSKFAILLDTLLDDAQEALRWHDYPIGLEDALIAHLKQVTAFFSEPVGYVFQALTGQALLDKKAAAELQSAFLHEQRSRDIDGFTCLLAKNSLAPPNDGTIGALVDMLLGPVYYRALISGVPADEELIERCAHCVARLARESS